MNNEPDEDDLEEEEEEEEVKENYNQPSIQKTSNDLILTEGVLYECFVKGENK